jgi:hypothetical protein
MKIYHADQPRPCIWMRDDDEMPPLGLNIDVSKRTLSFSLPKGAKVLYIVYDLPFHDKMEPLLTITDGRRVLTHRIYDHQPNHTTVWDVILTLGEKWEYNLVGYLVGTESPLIYDYDLRED